MTSNKMKSDNPHRLNCATFGEDISTNSARTVVMETRLQRKATGMASASPGMRTAEGGGSSSSTTGLPMGTARGAVIFKLGSEPLVTRISYLWVCNERSAKVGIRFMERGQKRGKKNQ